MFQFKFPDVGEGITEGVLVKWLVKEGDTVKADQSLAEVETDKAVVELPSPRTGKITKLAVAEGAEITVGQVIVEIETSEGPQLDTANEDSVGVVGDLSHDVTLIEDSLEHEHEATPAPAPTAAPAMRKIRKYDMWGMLEHVPFKGMRKAIAKAMTESESTNVHVTHTEMANVQALFEHREANKGAAAKDGIKLTYLAYLMKAVTKALEAHPYLNSSLEGEHIVLKKYYSIGFAVDTEEGLMVPVLKRVNQKTCLQVADEIVKLAEKAKTRDIDPMDMNGGSFTITSLGSIGGLFFTPIIRPPEAAILGLGRMHDAPVALDGEVKIQKLLPLSLSYDHRIVDGAQAARFLNTVIEHLQNPATLMEV